MTICGLFFAANPRASAEGLDRDTLLSDAPTVPNQGTIRITGGVVGTSDGPGVNNVQGQANVTAGIQWSIFDRFAADVSAYFQVGQQGPSARVRYQILTQRDQGIDLSGGVRFKTVGFHPNQGEVEFLVAAGHRFGQFEMILNAVFGVETGQGGGKDGEVKGFTGWRFNASLSAGIDGRIQMELADEEAAPVHLVAAPATRDYDLTVGPAISWMPMQTLQLQLLTGLAQPKKTNITAPVAVLQASLDL
jgi:hypothetical protein